MLRLLMFLLTLTIGCAHTGRSVVGGVAGPAQVTVPVYRNPCPLTSSSWRYAFMTVRLGSSCWIRARPSAWSAEMWPSSWVPFEASLLYARGNRRRHQLGRDDFPEPDWTAESARARRGGGNQGRSYTCRLSAAGWDSRNDVLKHFRLELDYPAQSLTLARIMRTAGWRRRTALFANMRGPGPVDSEKRGGTHRPPRLHFSTSTPARRA